jgi:hypothetical protein
MSRSLAPPLLPFPLAFSLAAAAAALVGCPPPASPKGPPPEYEEPAAPSWLRDGGAEAGSVSAAATPPAPVAGSRP